jgi:uncharacterized protein YxeA
MNRIITLSLLVTGAFIMTAGANTLSLKAEGTLRDGSFMELRKKDKKVVRIESVPGNIKKLHTAGFSVEMAVPHRLNLAEYEKLTIYVEVGATTDNLKANFSTWDYKRKRWQRQEKTIINRDRIVHMIDIFETETYVDSKNHRVKIRLETEKMDGQMYEITCDAIKLGGKRKAFKTEFEKAQAKAKQVEDNRVRVMRGEAGSGSFGDKVRATSESYKR